MQGGNSPSSHVAQRSYGRCGGRAHGRMNLYLQSRSWAHISRSWGGHIYIYIIIIIYLYTYLFIYLSLSFYTVNVYCDFTSIYDLIYIYNLI